MADSKRFPILETEDYTIDLEYTEEFAILHLPRVQKFTKSIYLQGREKLEDIKDFLFTTGFQAIWVAVFPEDEMTNKFVKRLGFEYAGDFENLSVYYIKESS